MQFGNNHHVSKQYARQRARPGLGGIATTLLPRKNLGISRLHTKVVTSDVDCADRKERHKAIEQKRRDRTKELLQQLQSLLVRKSANPPRPRPAPALWAPHRPLTAQPSIYRTPLHDGCYGTGIRFLPGHPWPGSAVTARAALWPRIWLSDRHSPSPQCIRGSSVNEVLEGAVRCLDPEGAPSPRECPSTIR